MAEKDTQGKRLTLNIRCASLINPEEIKKTNTFINVKFGGKEKQTETEKATKEPQWSEGMIEKKNVDVKRSDLFVKNNITIY
jgi:hypothetical protein